MVIQVKSANFKRFQGVGLDVDVSKHEPWKNGIVKIRQ